MGRDYKQLGYNSATSKYLFPSDSNLPRVLASLKIKDEDVYGAIHEDFMYFILRP